MEISSYFLPIKYGLTSAIVLLVFHLFLTLIIYFSTARPQYLQPFISDKNLPSELEYLIVSLKDPHGNFQQWNHSRVCQKLRFSAQMDCKLLEYRNVTMQSVILPFSVSGQVAWSGNTGEEVLDTMITVDSLFLNVGQHAVHSLNTAIQAWQQVSTFLSTTVGQHVLLDWAVCYHSSEEVQCRPKRETIKHLTGTQTAQGCPCSQGQHAILKDLGNMGSLCMHRRSYPHFCN